MRQSEKVGLTLNNSKGRTSDIKYKKLTTPYLLRTGYSDEPIAYTVEVIGKDCNGKEYRISNVYEEYHPLMAVGRAVVEFRKTIIVGSIEHILISERVVSNK